MTPRNMHAVRTDPVSWDGIENMIREYDMNVIIPRQHNQHVENQVWLKRLEDSIAEIKQSFSEWRGSIKVILWIITALLLPIFFGVMALVYDLLKWGLSTHWKW